MSLEANGAGALAPSPAPPVSPSPLGAVLSPSQVKCYLNCSARWWYRYALGLPDPPGASLVRGRVLHRMAATWFRAQLAGAVPEPDDLAEPFEAAWEEETEGA